MKRKMAVGVDIGGTNTAWGFVGDDGEILAGGDFATYSDDPPEQLVNRLAQAIKADFLSMDSDDVEMIGIGVGAPNANYHTGTIHHPPNFEWEIVEFVELLRKHIDLPIVITNDANAAAIGEMVFGDAVGMTDFIVTTLGTGLGSGIVTGGRLLLGYDGFAGELGHVVSGSENGRQCGCGKRGCLETYASATGLVRTGKELLQERSTESSLRLVKIDELTGKDIGMAAAKGDQLALEVFETTGKALGEALANTVALLSPQTIFLFGGVAYAGDLIVEPTKRYMERYLMPVFRDRVDIRISGLMNRNAAILGTAALIKQELELAG